MLIPSIDLMGGKAVQLEQGKKLKLTHPGDPVELAKEFNRYGPVAVVDLDAALGQGDNLELIKRICRVAETRVGGGIRTIERAKALLRAGASKLIIGTAATEEFLKNFKPEQVIVALDHIKGEVLDKGWTSNTGENISKRAIRLAPYCSGYLCTWVKSEGTLQGLEHEEVQVVNSMLPHPMTVAGGVKDTEEAIELIKSGLEVQVGMSLYTGKLHPATVIMECLNYNPDGLIPTIAQDEAGQVLMLAYSSKDSIFHAVREGRGVYYSRSRQELWFKGETSGNTQELITCRTDCDRDALLFTVRQKGVACHNGTYSCFGDQQFSLNKLFHRLRQRLDKKPESSYTVQLAEDRNLLSKKIKEEAEEVINFTDKENLKWEAADLIYHLSVLLAAEDLDIKDVLNELAGREH